MSEVDPQAPSQRNEWPPKGPSTLTKAVAGVVVALMVVLIIVAFVKAIAFVWTL